MNKTTLIFIRKTIFAFATVVMTTSVSLSQTKISQQSWFSKAEEIATYQLKKAAKRYKVDRNPRSINPDGSIRLTTITDWTNGFFPGSLWYGYELSGDQTLASAAQGFTLALDSVRHIKNTHDVGFMLYCSYGNAYRLTGDKQYLTVLADGASNLYNRYNPKIGAIRSWDFGNWQFPVIIDNMMNLEFLYWAGAALKKIEYIDAATQHALTTMKHHYRKDYSSYHLVNYSPETGQVISKETHQGLTHESAWARGQAWGLYGYVMCYENTKKPEFLAQAKHVASFIMHHPAMPEDKIPAWDYNVHNALESPGAPRDVSAAAVTASALIQLSTLIPEGQVYFTYAEEILRSLSSQKYLANKDENGLFILKHSVGAFLYNSEADTPINYADYYFLEALKRYKKIKNSKK